MISTSQALGQWAMRQQLTIYSALPSYWLASLRNWHAGLASAKLTTRGRKCQHQAYHILLSTHNIHTVNTKLGAKATTITTIEVYSRKPPISGLLAVAGSSLSTKTDKIHTTKALLSSDSLYYCALRTVSLLLIKFATPPDCNSPCCGAAADITARRCGCVVSCPRNPRHPAKVSATTGIARAARGHVPCAISCCLPAYNESGHRSR